MEKITLFDSFAGIGALHQALKNLGVEVEVVGFSEIDKYAIRDYCAIHNISEDLNYGDISKIDTSLLPNFDLFNFSFPCTDISVAGKQQGLGEGTRSGLYIEGLRIIEAKKPKYIMIENVKNLIGKKFVDDFKGILNELNELGYNTYVPTNNKNKYITLNAKNFGIPQNRERVFVIAVRKDVEQKELTFNQGKDYGYRLKDILESKVEDKYYLSEEIQNRFKTNGKIDIDHNELNVIGTSAPSFRKIGQRDLTYGINGVMSTLTATDYKQPKQILENNNKKPNKLINLGNVYPSKGQAGNVFDKKGISPTLNTMQGGGRQPKVLIKEATKKGYVEANDGDSVNLAFPNSKTRRGRVGKQVAQTLDCSCNQGVVENYKIRKLTPRECWRLMGFDDEQFDKAKSMGTSDSQLYKQAGNCIVVNVPMSIFNDLFELNFDFNTYLNDFYKNLHNKNK